MRSLSVREVRAELTRLDELVEREGEIIVTRRGRPIARIVPIGPRRPMPSHAELRAGMPRLGVPSERLIAEERDRL